MIGVGLSVRTQRHPHGRPRILEAAMWVMDEFVSGIDRNRMNRKEQAAAIGAGTPIGSDKRAVSSRKKNAREGRQDAKCTVDRMHRGDVGYRYMCANTSPDTDRPIVHPHRRQA